MFAVSNRMTPYSRRATFLLNTPASIAAAAGVGRSSATETTSVGHHPPTLRNAYCPHLRPPGYTCCPLRPCRCLHWRRHPVNASETFCRLQGQIKSLNHCTHHSALPLYPLRHEPAVPAHVLVVVQYMENCGLERLLRLAKHIVVQQHQPKATALRQVTQWRLVHAYQGVWGELRGVQQGVGLRS
eukprot:scaffold1016_cov258-Pinguiococcus_pyrenoidosus.AAC.9